MVEPSPAALPFAADLASAAAAAAGRRKAMEERDGYNKDE